MAQEREKLPRRSPPAPRQRRSSAATAGDVGLNREG